MTANRTARGIAKRHHRFVFFAKDRKVDSQLGVAEIGIMVTFSEEAIALCRGKAHA
jgi:hypothetical protein